MGIGGEKNLMAGGTPVKRRAWGLALLWAAVLWTGPARGATIIGAWTSASTVAPGDTLAMTVAYCDSNATDDFLVALEPSNKSTIQSCNTTQHFLVNSVTSGSSSPLTTTQDVIDQYGSDGGWSGHNFPWGTSCPGGAVTQVFVLTMPSTMTGSYNLVVAIAPYYISCSSTGSAVEKSFAVTIGGSTPSPTFTFTKTPTPNLSLTPTKTPTAASTPTPGTGNTNTPTKTPTPAVTPTFTKTFTPVVTPTFTKTPTPTFTPVIICPTPVGATSSTLHGGCDCFQNTTQLLMDTKVFGMSLSDLQALADYSGTETQPVSIATKWRLTYYSGSVTFDTSQTNNLKSLNQYGLLVVNGNLVMDPDCCTWHGVVFCTGNVVIQDNDRVEGSIILGTPYFNGSPSQLTLSGSSGNYGEVIYSPYFVTKTQQQVAVYKENLSQRRSFQTVPNW